jgi:hypothetical protein
LVVSVKVGGMPFEVQKIRSGLRLGLELRSLRPGIGLGLRSLILGIGLALRSLRVECLSKYKKSGLCQGWIRVRVSVTVRDKVRVSVNVRV